MRLEDAGNCDYIDGSITIPRISPLAGQSHTYILLMLKQHAGVFRKLVEGILLREHRLQ